MLPKWFSFASMFWVLISRFDWLVVCTCENACGIIFAVNCSRFLGCIQMSYKRLLALRHWWSSRLLILPGRYLVLGLSCWEVQARCGPSEPPVMGCAGFCSMLASVLPARHRFAQGPRCGLWVPKKRSLSLRRDFQKLNHSLDLGRFHAACGMNIDHVVIFLCFFFIDNRCKR